MQDRGWTVEGIKQDAAKERSPGVELVHGGRFLGSVILLRSLCEVGTVDCSRTVQSGYRACMVGAGRGQGQSRVVVVCCVAWGGGVVAWGGVVAGRGGLLLSVVAGGDVGEGGVRGTVEGVWWWW